jgi:hypothetical protein
MEKRAGVGVLGVGSAAGAHRLLTASGTSKDNTLSTLSTLSTTRVGTVVAGGRDLKETLVLAQYTVASLLLIALCSANGEMARGLHFYAALSRPRLLAQIGSAALNSFGLRVVLQLVQGKRREREEREREEREREEREKRKREER